MRTTCQYRPAVAGGWKFSFFERGLRGSSGSEPIRSIPVHNSLYLRIVTLNHPSRTCVICWQFKPKTANRAAETTHSPKIVR